MNSWGSCKPVDCCASSGGCASCCFLPSSPTYPDKCVYGTNHTVYLYSTSDHFKTFVSHGAILTPLNRKPGVEFRPHVIHNTKTDTFVMWYENRPSAIKSPGYSVAISASPLGPFRTINTSVQVHGDVPGDYDLLVDGDGSCYFVQSTTKGLSDSLSSMNHCTLLSLGPDLVEALPCAMLSPLVTMF